MPDTRKKYIGADWKAKLRRNEAEELIQAYIKKITVKEHQEVIVFPSTLHLEIVSKTLANSPIKIGAQNMHWKDNGAFTGEVCASQLLDYDVEYILLGHSERREFFNENYEIINKKLKLAFKRRLKPILCVGESLKEKDAGLTELVIVDQIESALVGLKVNEVKDVIITYEPIWAVGAGKPVPIQKSEHVVEIIHKILVKHFKLPSLKNIPVLYGGSIDTSQSESYLENSCIDGVLVGKASLIPDKFAKIVNDC
jgi:triosephosphate isomerase